MLTQTTIHTQTLSALANRIPQFLNAGSGYDNAMKLICADELITLRENLSAKGTGLTNAVADKLRVINTSGTYGIGIIDSKTVKLATVIENKYGSAIWLPDNTALQRTLSEVERRMANVLM